LSKLTLTALEYHIISNEDENTFQNLKLFV
jgi:hypothetical protein